MLSWSPRKRLLVTPALMTVLVAAWLGLATKAPAQDMMKDLDLTSAEMTEAEMSREQVIEQLNAATEDQPADFTAKRLNGLDLAGLDFSGAILRAARLNNANLKGVNLEGAILDQAWMLNVDLTGANLRGAKLFQAQLIGATLDQADFSKARVASDLSKASIRGANFTGASLGADMKNQSMGMMRGVLRKADLEGVDFTDADLSRVDFEFASLRGVNFTGANLMRASLGGADLTGAIVEGANFNEADVTSAKLISLIGAEKSNIENARHLSRAFRD